MCSFIAWRPLPPPPTTHCARRRHSRRQPCDRRRGCGVSKPRRHRTPQLNTLKQRHPWMTWVGSRRGRVSATYTQCKDMIIDCGRRLQRRSCVRWWRQARTRSPLAHPTLGWERACGEAHASQASTQPLAGIAAPRDEPSTACRARAASRPIPRHPVRRRAE